MLRLWSFSDSLNYLFPDSLLFHANLSKRRWFSSRQLCVETGRAFLAQVDVDAADLAPGGLADCHLAGCECHDYHRCRLDFEVEYREQPGADRQVTLDDDELELRVPLEYRVFQKRRTRTVEEDGTEVVKTVRVQISDWASTYTRAWSGAPTELVGSLVLFFSEVEFNVD